MIKAWLIEDSELGILPLNVKELSILIVALDRLIERCDAECRRGDLSEDDQSDLVNDRHYAESVRDSLRAQLDQLTSGPKTR